METRVEYLNEGMCKIVLACSCSRHRGGMCRLDSVIVWGPDAHVLAFYALAVTTEKVLLCS